MYNNTSIFTIMSSRHLFASRLAKFLRLNGSDVIQGQSKLSLTTSALFVLNNLFDTVLFSTDGVQILPASEDELLDEDFFENVKFLFEFIRRTSSLKIFHGGQTLRGGIDVSRFANLKILEFHKVPMHLVIGLNTLCPQFTVLICHRSIYCLKEIFYSGESDTVQRKLWLQLKELNVAYNYLEGFDQSLGMLPNVDYIDASHNSLKHVDELQMMEKLVFLNLSFNLLENVPVLSGFSCRSIRVLFLRNNILEDLDGIEMLPCLQELDVSYNCISEHSMLRSLKSLCTLKSLNLEGNPIFFHKRHRILATRHLHPSVISRGILLNRILMGPEEVLKTMRSARSSSFYAQCTSTHQTAINVLIEGADSGAQAFSEASLAPFRVEQMVPSSNEDVSMDSTGRQASESSDIDSLIHTSSKKRKWKKKKKKITAVIEPAFEQEKEEQVPPHIQTKHQLETRRQQLKEGWLIPTPTFQEIAVSKDVPPNTPSTNALEPTLVTNVIKLDDSPNNKELSDAEKKASEEQSKFMDDTLEKLKNFDMAEPTIKDDTEKEVLPPSEDLNANVSYPTEDKDSEISDAYEDEPEGCLYLVETCIESISYSLCLKIKENSIKEIDLLSSKTLDELDLRCLASVTLDENTQDDSSQCTLCLNFDTANSTRQKRLYEFGDIESAQTMYSKLKPFADAKVMNDSILGALQCLKCSSEFSKDVAKKKVIKGKNPYSNIQTEEGELRDFPLETLACPNCGSTVVVELETMPVPSVQIANSSMSGPSKNYSPSSKRKQESADNSLKVESDITIAETSPHAVKKIHSASHKVRHSSLQSNQSSSITVISDTESNLDAISEKNSPCSPLSSPTVAPPPIQSLRTFPNSTNSDGIVPQTISSSVTESIGNNKLESLEKLTAQTGEYVDFAKLVERREKFSFETFTSINHEIFFYLDIEVFDDNETLCACLEAGIVPMTTSEEFTGLLAISNRKLYIINSSKKHKVDLRERMKQVYSCALRQLNVVQTLLGNQGFSITCGSDNKTFLILVRDADLCNCFTSLLIEITNGKLQPTDVPQFVMETEESLAQVRLEIFSSSQAEVNDNEKDCEMLLYLFGFFQESEEADRYAACFVITSESLYVAKLQFRKQKGKSPLFHYTSIDKQRITDLIEVKIKKDLHGAEINFKDEERNVASRWTLFTQTKSALFSMIATFKGPWEAVFGVELPLTLV